MAKSASTVGLEADRNDLDDFDVSEHAIEQALTARRLRGAQVAPTKKPLSLRIDEDVLDRWRASGPGWQTRMNEVLRSAAP